MDAILAARVTSRQMSDGPPTGDAIPSWISESTDEKTRRLERELVALRAEVRTQLPQPNWLAVTSAVIVAVSAFLPWAEVSGIVDMSVTGVARGDGWVCFGFAVMVGMVGMVGMTGRRGAWTGLIAGVSVATALFCGWEYQTLTRLGVAVGGTGLAASKVGPGLYVAGATATVMTLAAGADIMRRNG